MYQEYQKLFLWEDKVYTLIMSENKSNSTNSSQIVFLVLAFIAGFFASKFWYDFQASKSTLEVDVPDEIVVPGDTNTESSPSEEEGETLISQEDLEAIRVAFAQKYDKPLEDITITPQEINSEKTHVVGGVILGEGPGNAGRFWVYKEEGEWEIAADGNGSPECAVLEDAGFPEDLQEGCF